MIFKKVTSFARALSVANLLEAIEHGDLSFGIEEYWLIEAYQNGREQGICVWNPPMPAYFIAEARGSDKLVVYKGKYTMQSVSEDAYKNPKYFDKIEDCADWLEEDIANEIILMKAKRARK